jgi:hypothetical protein
MTCPSLTTTAPTGTSPQVGGAARLLQRLAHEVFVHGSIKIHSYMRLTVNGLTDIPLRNTDTAQ